MQMLSFNFIMPQSWLELSDKQLRYVYQLLAGNHDIDEIKTLCLLRWSGTKVLGRIDGDAYLLKNGKAIFAVTPLAFAELLQLLDWLGSIPNAPVRLSKINRRRPLPADFSGVPFETFIICDNLYQGYLHTQNDALIDKLGSTLYSRRSMTFKPEERISIFYWFAALKDYFSHKFPDFFQPISAASDGNLLGSASPSVEDAMNAQIRALTKGDVTKESVVLALDTHRALTELNAQAREYKELNAKMKSK